jgi:hypothetical protein
MSVGERTLLVWFILNLGIRSSAITAGLDRPNNCSCRYAQIRLFFGFSTKRRYDPSCDGHGPAFGGRRFWRENELVSRYSSLIFGICLFQLQLCGLCCAAKRWFHTGAAWGSGSVVTQPLLLNKFHRPAVRGLFALKRPGVRMAGAQAGPVHQVAKPFHALAENCGSETHRRRMFLKAWPSCSSWGWRSSCCASRSIRLR